MKDPLNYSPTDSYDLYLSKKRQFFEQNHPNSNKINIPTTLEKDGIYAITPFDKIGPYSTFLGFISGYARVTKETRDGDEIKGTVDLRGNPLIDPAKIKSYEDLEYLANAVPYAFIKYVKPKMLINRRKNPIPGLNNEIFNVYLDKAHKNIRQLNKNEVENQ